MRPSTGGRVARRGSGSTSQHLPVRRRGGSRRYRHIRCPAAAAALSSYPVGPNEMEWLRSASFWPIAPARRSGQQPWSRAVPMCNRPRRDLSGLSAGKASRQCRHPRTCARTPSFRVKASLCRLPIAKRSPKALRRPSAAPTGTCRRVGGHQYIASLQPLSALS